MTSEQDYGDSLGWCQVSELGDHCRIEGSVHVDCSSLSSGWPLKGGITFLCRICMLQYTHNCRQCADCFRLLGLTSAMQTLEQTHGRSKLRTSCLDDKHLQNVENFRHLATPVCSNYQQTNSSDEL